LYPSSSIIRIIKKRRKKLAGYVARMGGGEKRNSCKLLVGMSERKRPVGRPRRRRVDNIKMGLGEVGWDGLDWVCMAQSRDQWWALVNKIMNLRAP
jgi:hypothetical protein